MVCEGLLSPAAASSPRPHRPGRLCLHCLALASTDVQGTLCTVKAPFRCTRSWKMPLSRFRLLDEAAICQRSALWVET